MFSELLRHLLTVIIHLLKLMRMLLLLMMVQQLILLYLETYRMWFHNLMLWTGISASLVNTGKDGSANQVYSIVVSSSATGKNSGFQITASGASRWETPAYPGGNTDNNRFTQFAADSNFKLDGVEVSRTTNSITDLIEGVTIDLKADDSGSVQ